MAALRALAREIDRTDQEAADRFGVNRTDLRAVELLATAGALAPTALAATLGFTTGGVTTVIDRLERAGYARRRPDPNDRRRVIVEATERLRAREAEIFGELLRSTEGLVASYSDAELATIHDFLERFRAVAAGRGKAAGATEAQVFSS
jgi:DNA-binding MarR family transcriptional regulator